MATGLADVGEALRLTAPCMPLRAASARAGALSLARLALRAPHTGCGPSLTSWLRCQSVLMTLFGDGDVLVVPAFPIPEAIASFLLGQDGGAAVVDRTINRGCSTDEIASFL